MYIEVVLVTTYEHAYRFAVFITSQAEASFDAKIMDLTNTFAQHSFWSRGDVRLIRAWLDDLTSFAKYELPNAHTAPVNKDAVSLINQDTTSSVRVDAGTEPNAGRPHDALVRQGSGNKRLVLFMMFNTLMHEVLHFYTDTVRIWNWNFGKC